MVILLCHFIVLGKVRKRCHQAYLCWTSCTDKPRMSEVPYGLSTSLTWSLKRMDLLKQLALISSKKYLYYGQTLCKVVQGKVQEVTSSFIINMTWLQSILVGGRRKNIPQRTSDATWGDVQALGEENESWKSLTSQTLETEVIQPTLTLLFHTRKSPVFPR